MQFFIDAYDWVMVPNVYGMSQYACKNAMTTKPYISGSNYILKMSNFKKGAWTNIWNALYWYFIAKKEPLLSKNARMRTSYMLLKRMKNELLQKHFKQAQFFLKTLQK
jgi:deoxyribodipyrimidine photolyase-related protein